MVTTRLHIAYDGTDYCGWQVQSDERTVEGVLTTALTRILDADEAVKVQGASRTDSGVHAEGQVAHFRHAGRRDMWDFARGLNALTDDAVSIIRVQPVSDQFHARHSSTGKIYRYRIWNHRFSHPFLRYRSWKVPVPLDIDAMRRAAELMVGEHDFAGFRSSNCSCETTDRRMRRVEVIDRPGAVVEVVVEGDAFLQHMVRIMVGTIADVGQQKFGVQRVREVLQSGDRRRGGITAPARGLTLEKVFYPDFDWDDDEPVLGGPYMAGLPPVGPPE